MRFRLRTLLIVLAMAPLLIAAWHWWGAQWYWSLDFAIDWLAGNNPRY
jgi:hypothetical protein